MKNKLVWWLLICVLFVAVTSSSVFAPYEQVSKYGITNANQNWLSDRKGTSAYTTNWTDLGQGDNMPLVYDLDMDGVNEIIQSRSGTIKVYALNGSVLASKIVADLGDRQLSAFNSTNCPNHQALFVTTSTNVREMCFNGTALTDGYICQMINSPNAPDYTGIGMAYQSSNIVGMVYTGSTTRQLMRCDFTGNGTDYSNNNFVYQPKGVPATGNLLGDGYVYWLFPYFDDTTNSTGVYYVNFVGGGTYLNISYNNSNFRLMNDSPPIVIRRGGGNNDDILVPYEIFTTGPLPNAMYERDFWYMDATGYPYASSGWTPAGRIYGSCYWYDVQVSNPVQLGTNGDICYSYDKRSCYNSGSTNFVCRTPSTLVFSYTQALTLGIIGWNLLAMDMNNDNYADFFFGDGWVGGASLCLYTNNTNPLNCTSYGAVADYIYGVDADNDGARDIIFSDNSNDQFKVWLTGGAPQNITSCNDSDTASFPSISYYVQGTMNATGLYPVSDWCNGNQLYEYYCINATTPSLYPTLLDCGISGMICQNGACVTPPVNGTCIDSDNLSYPSVNSEVQGTAIANGSNVTYNQTDVCYSETNLKEYYCVSPTSSNLWYANYSCSYDGKICQDGACVAGQGGGCSNSNNSYTYPTIWLEQFPYNDSITNHGWYNYPWVVGNNAYGTCNRLFMNASLNLIPIYHQFSLNTYSNYTLTWDMASESTLVNETYEPFALPVNVYVAGTSTADPIIDLYWLNDGTIFSWDADNFTQVGNWQTGELSSYKVVINQQNHTYDFYYTNSSNHFAFVLGASGRTFILNHSLTRFVVNPNTYTAGTYKSLGVWLDNIRIVEGVQQQQQNQTNFCSMTNYGSSCVFFDHFDYSDSTYTHGWYMYNTTPVASVVTYANNSQGYYFQHLIDTIHDTDNNGVFNLQFRALFPQPSELVFDIINFNLYTPELATPVDFQFSEGLILDNNRNGEHIGSYDYNTWNTYTMEINMQTNTYDFYIGNNKVVSQASMPVPATAISKGGFYVNTNSSVKIDYITIIKSTLLADALTGGNDYDSGVPLADLTWCWSETNGTFDWSCCTPEENNTKSFWCPVRVTGRYYLGNATNFILGNFIYFLIIVIVFVLITPYIAPKLRGNR